MKRIVSLVLALALSLGLLACIACAEETAEPAPDAQVEESVESSVEEAEEEAPAQWLDFSGLFEIKWYTGAIIVALVALFIVLIVASKKARWDSRTLANAAMCIAIAFVLSCIRLVKFPQGGSVTPLSMLPLILFAVACGPLKGAVVGCAYGLLQLVQDPYVIHPIQLLVDYPLAFGAMALGGLVNYMPLKDKNKWLQLPVAIVLGSLGRYIMAVLSGTVFFAEYAPADQTALAYSLTYNVGYLGPDAALCLIAAFIPGAYRLVDMLRRNTAVQGR